MYNFDEYIRQGEPDKKEKGIVWKMAIGLQQTDGLKPSAYLIETAIKNIEGDITFEEVKARLDNYYKTLPVQPNNTDDERTEEADKVGVNVGVKNQILNNLKNNPNLTAKELAVILNKSARTIERNIKELREKNIICRVGSDKTGSWQINKA